MQPPTTTYDLVERFRRGDQEAFTLLFEKYRARLGVMIHYKLSEDLRRSVEVDDVLQETLLSASQDIDRFQYQSPGSFLRWLARIADHVIIDMARHEGRQKRDAGDRVPLRSPSNPGGFEPADSKTPSRLFAARQGVEALLQKLDDLPEDYRQVILLARFEQLTTAEIAERLGKPREAVSLLLHRALKRIREAS